MATINKQMKTFNVPSGNDTICYEVVDDKGRKCLAKDWETNSGAAFAAGEYVIKDGVVYQFKTAHTAGAAWSSSEVDATNLGAELQNLKSALNQSSNALAGYSNEASYTLPDSIFVQGSINATTGEDTDNAARIKSKSIIPITTGMKIKFTAGTVITHYALRFYDITGSICGQQGFGNADTTISDSDYCYFRIVFRSGDGSTNITPAQYDATVTVVTKMLTEIQNTIRIGAKTFITSSANMTAPYDDLNTFPVNSFCLYQMSGDGPAHMPSDVNVGKGISVYSYNSIKDAVNGCVQILIQNDGNAYWRIGWNNSYRDWVAIGAKGEIDTLKASTQNIVAHNEYQRGFTFDDISGADSTDASGWMSKYAYKAGYVEKLRIKLTDTTSGYVLIIGANTETVLFITSVSASESGILDITVNKPINEPFYVGIRLAKVAYITSSSAPQYDYSNSIPGASKLPTVNVGQKLSITWKSNMRIYFAIEAVYSDSLTAAVSAMPSLSEYNLAYASFSMFPTIGIIGDSYASGEIFKSSTSAVDSYYLSWGQTIARQCGVSVTNYSQGGMDTHKFVNYSAAQPGSINRLEADDPKHLYLLVLGINDPTNNGGISYLGTIADIPTESPYTSHPDTFYGNYGEIIERIKAHAENAKIIMVTTAYTDSVRVQFNAAIEELAEHYQIPCMVQLDNPFLSSNLYWNTMYYGHPTAVTYSAMAQAFIQMFGKCAYEYYEYFKDYILPTDYPLS